MIKILLLIDYSSEFDRKLLRGLVQYSKEHGPWIFYRLPSYYRKLYGEEGVLKWARKWKADAIIGQWNSQNSESLNKLNIPVVLQNYHHRSSIFSNITGDYKGTGKIAADFFAQRLFKDYAYFGVKGVIWSDERREGYEQEVKCRGGNFYCYENNRSEDEIREDVSRWLKSLPKPIALFCCDDAHALYISEVCKINNINIPEDVSLLGVDNDSLICTISDPPISSIELDVEKGGYALGRRVHQLINKESANQFNIVINPIRIEIRQSSEKFNIKDPYILKTVEFIEEYYNTNLTVEQLTDNIPLSRRNLEVKFKKSMGTSIYQYILTCRINHLADKLLVSDASMANLALEVGFKDSNNLSRIFKKYKGCSPKEYKQKMSDSIE